MTDDSTSISDEAADRVRASFARQRFMTYLGATITDVRKGEVTIRLDARPELAQQHGYIHAGVTSAIADSAGGYAALTLMDAASEVLTVEYKINLLAPARGDHLEAVGTVVRAGRTLTVCNVDVWAIGPDGRTLIAAGQQTLISVGPGR